MFRRKRDWDSDDQNVSPDDVLAADHAWLLEGIGDGDDSTEATLRRLELLRRLIEDGSVAAAEAVLERLRATPLDDEGLRFAVGYAEISLLASRRNAWENPRMIELANELIEEYGDDRDLDLRAALLQVDLCRQQSPEAIRAWIAQTAGREDFDELMFHPTAEEAWKGAHAILDLFEEETEDNEFAQSRKSEVDRVVAQLRWWIDPTTPLPPRAAPDEIGPPGTVVPRTATVEEETETLGLAVELASMFRLGDALACVTAVRESTQQSGRTMSAALTGAIEGELWLLLGDPAKGIEHLWDAAASLRELASLEVSGQLFLEVGNIAATRFDGDLLLEDRADGNPGLPGSRVAVVLLAAYGIFEIRGDEEGMYGVGLARARLSLTHGRLTEAREELAKLDHAPKSGRRSYELRRELLRARVELVRRDIATCDRALKAARRNSLATNPWWSWQVDALEAEIRFAGGDPNTAWAAISRSFGTLDRLRWLISDEHKRAVWATSRAEAWRLGLEVASARGDSAGGLSVIEAAKSNLLARLLLAHGAASPDPELAALVREGIARVARSAKTLEASTLSDAFTEQKTMIESIRRASAYLAAGLDDAPDVRDSLAEIESTLGSFAFVNLLLLDERTVWVCSGTHAGPSDLRMVELADEEIAALAALDAVADGIEVAALVARGGLERVSHLGRRLLAGLDTAGGEYAPTLLISGSGVLSRIPFAALQLADGTDVIDRYALLYAPSIRAASALAGTPVTDGEAVLFTSDPAGDLMDTLSAQAESARSAWPSLIHFADDRASLHRLEALSRTGRLASASRLIIAGHGAPHPREPLASGLLMGDGAVLTAGLLAGLHLPPILELWTCSSGAERPLGGDERLGVVTAGFAGGSATVLVSLWALDTRGATVLAERYHQACAEGLAPHQALRHAQLESRGDLCPYVWGAMCVNGLPPRLA